MMDVGLDLVGSSVWKRVEAQVEGTTAMARPLEDDVQTQRDIRRAHALVSRLRGLTEDESMAALRDHAALTGVSIHTAALAVLAEWHPVGEPHRKAPAAEASTASDRSGRILLRWQGREKAHVAISGPHSEDLATRLHRTVEKAIRAGALHLIIDTRGTTGAAAEFDDVLTWAGQRLWARHGSLIVRARETASGEHHPA